MVICRQSGWPASQGLSFRCWLNIQPFTLLWYYPCDDITTRYVQSLMVICPVFRTSIPYVHDRLIKMSLALKTLQASLLFISIFYTLYTYWKNRLHNRRIMQVGRYLCRPASSTLLLREGSATAGCSRLCPARLLVSPKTENSQFLWETHSTVQTNSQASPPPQCLNLISHVCAITSQPFTQHH